MRPERNIRVTIYNEHGSQVTQRAYAYVDTAARRLVQIMILDGQVKWVAEIYHHVTGLQIGTVKINAKGRLILDFVWGKEL